MVHSADALHFADLQDGKTAVHRYRITEDVHASFVSAFDDRSPIHVDDQFARDRGFPERVAHGAILNGFLSHFVGMRLPGATALLLSVDIRYLAPSHVGDELELTARVAQRSESTRTIVLAVTFENLTRGRAAAAGRALVRVES